MGRQRVVWGLLGVSLSGQAMELEVSPLIEGRSVTFTVTQAPANASVRLVRSAQVPVLGATCPPALNGGCVDLQAPVAFGVVRTDAAGEGTLRMRLPNGMTSRDVWLQAVARGTNELSPVVASRVMRECGYRDASAHSTGHTAGLAALRECGTVQSRVYWRPLNGVMPELPYLVEAMDLYVEVDDTMVSVVGPPQLTSVWSLSVDHGEALERIEGFDALETVTSLRLYDLPALQSVDALDGSVAVHSVHLRSLPGMTDLSMVSDLVDVGSLVVQDLPLVDLTGMPATNAQFGTLSVRDMPNLQSLNGHTPWSDNLSFELTNSPSFTDMSGLSSASSLGALDIYEQPGVTDFSAIDGLELLGYVVLSDLPDLTTVEHLRTGLGGSYFQSGGRGLMSLHDLPSLTSLAGLESLTGLQELALVDLPLVTDLAPLAGLTWVHQSLVISDNDLLTDVSALSSLEQSWNVRVDDNEVLCETDVFAALAGATINSLVVEDNHGVCP